MLANRAEQGGCCGNKETQIVHRSEEMLGSSADVVVAAILDGMGERQYEQGSLYVWGPFRVNAKGEAEIKGGGLPTSLEHSSAVSS